MKSSFGRFICAAVVLSVVLLCGCQSKPAGTADSNISSGSQSSETNTSSGTTNTESDVSSTVSSEDNSSTQGSSTGSESSSQAQSSSNSSLGHEQVHKHTYTTKTVPATCLAGGYTLKACNCGHSEKTNKTAALGHSFGAWKTVTAATTTSTGSEQRVCSRCQKSESRTTAKLPMSVNEQQQEILRLVNIERQKQGLAPLQYYAAGQAAANVRATEIAESFSHTRPNGTDCFTAFDELDLHYWAAGENIAYGQPDCASVMTAWMNSDGHRANILNNNFTHLVVGVYEVQMSGYTRIHWVQLFISPM